VDKKDKEIEQKLVELESAIENEEKSSVVNLQGSTSLSTPEPTSMKSDTYYFLGIALVIAGILMLFQHIRVGSSFFAALGLGSGGFGLLLIPLMVGIGWIMYAPKSKVGWIILAASCGIIFFAALSSLIMTFPGMSLLGLIIMLLPFAAGGALILKGVGGPKGLEDKMRSEKPVK
jgi:hypothetical protein